MASVSLKRLWICALGGSSGSGTASGVTRQPDSGVTIREFKKTTTATATATSLNKRFNEQNNSCPRAL